MPGVSTNRDRAIPYRGHRHYFQSSSRIGVWRMRLSALALVLSMGWVCAGLLNRERMQADVSHGPLTESHSAWASRCDACHIPFNEPGCEAAGLMDCRARWRAFRCNSCHPGPRTDSKNYAPHYSSSQWHADERSQDCSSCHHDHQGKSFSLTRVSDVECARCHRNLETLHAKSDGAYSGPARTVTNFNKDHPEFRVLTQGNGLKRALKFNHGLHLAVGISASDPNSKDVNPNAQFRLKDVDPRYTAQYRPYTSPEGNPDSPLHLDCAACHQLDSGREPNTSKTGGLGIPNELAFPARPAGAYYLPITFEKHCQACHSLKTTGLASNSGVNIESFELPHRLQPAEVDKLIRGEIARQIEAKDKLFLKTPLPPNDRLDSPRAVDVPKTLRDATNELAEMYNRLLFNRTVEAPPSANISGGYSCMKCHSASPSESDSVRTLRIDPTPVRTIWMPNGRFDHSKHRVVNCAECHSMWDKPADAKRVGTDWKGEAVNLPSVTTCQKCHAPAGGNGRGGIRHGCVDCHRYHGAELPLQGPGSPHRVPQSDQRFDIGTFLRGPRTMEGRR